MTWTIRAANVRPTLYVALAKEISPVDDTLRSTVRLAGAEVGLDE
jgi:hypothetical protein